MEFTFCRRCGQPLTHLQENAYRCAAGHAIYMNPAPAAGILFVNQQNEVLLAVRGIEPHKGMLDAPGGFVNGGETLEQAAAREIREELSLEPDEYETPVYLCSGVGRYEIGGEEEFVCTTLFWSRLKTERKLEPSDDVAGLEWLPIHAVDMAKIHDEDIRVGIKALQQQFPEPNKE